MPGLKQPINERGFARFPSQSSKDDGIWFRLDQSTREHLLKAWSDVGRFDLVKELQGVVGLSNHQIADHHRMPLAMSFDQPLAGLDRRWCWFTDQQAYQH